MSAPITDPTVETPPAGDDTGNKDEAGKTFDADYVKKLRDEAARYRTEAKANADAAKRLAEYEAANQTELEKAQKAAAEAAARLAEYERTTLRQKVALDLGVPAKWVGRLQGETEEELRSDAESILADIAANTPRSPRPDPSQGARFPGSVSGKDAGYAEAQKRFGLKQ